MKGNEILFSDPLGQVSVSLIKFLARGANLYTFQCVTGSVRSFSFLSLALSPNCHNRTTTTRYTFIMATEFHNYDRFFPPQNASCGGQLTETDRGRDRLPLGA